MPFSDMYHLIMRIQGMSDLFSLLGCTMVLDHLGSEYQDEKSQRGTSSVRGMFGAGVLYFAEDMICEGRVDSFGLFSIERERELLSV